MNILTLKVGSKYSSVYVNRLYNSIKRNSTVDFKFYCYTEDPEVLDKDIIIVPIEDPLEFKLQWHKLKFHQEGFGGIPNGEKCLILDIDWIITGEMDDILLYPLPPKHFGCFKRWWSNRLDDCMINGGFQMFYMGDTDYLWQTFSSNPGHWQEHYINIGEAKGPVNGEQNFIDQHVIQDRSWFPMEWFAKYNDEEIVKIQYNWQTIVGKDEPYYLGGEFDECIKMVHFSNADNNMELIKDQWINNFWY